MALDVDVVRREDDGRVGRRRREAPPTGPPARPASSSAPAIAAAGASGTASSRAARSRRRRGSRERVDPLDQQLEEAVGVDVDGDVAVRLPLARPQRSTYVRPRESSAPVSTLTPRCLVSTRSGRTTCATASASWIGDAVAAVDAGGGSGCRSRAARATSRPARPAAQPLGVRSANSAWCVTSSPTIVSSMPLVKTRAPPPGRPRC